jgi:uncharacterized membrane protein YkvA (DUF1232 family)
MTKEGKAMANKILKYGAIGLFAGAFGGVFLLGIFFLVPGGIIGVVIGIILGYRANVQQQLVSDVDQLRLKIERVLTDQSKVSASKQAMAQWLKEKTAQSTAISEANQDLLFTVVTAYVRRTPDLMDALIKTFKWTDMEGEIVFLLKKKVFVYFESNENLIPDSFGVAGLLDDAYLIQCMIEKLANDQGGALAKTIESSIDLHAANAFVAALLPANVVTALHRKVDAALRESEARQMAARIAAQQYAKMQEGWRQGSRGVDMKREIVRDEIYSDLAKDGIYIRPGM